MAEDTGDLAKLTADERLALKRLLEEMERAKGDDVTQAIRELGDIIRERNAARARWGGIFDTLFRRTIMGAIWTVMGLIALGFGAWVHDWMGRHGYVKVDG
jgi:hypothetical protein